MTKNTQQKSQSAILYRMAMGDHTCPYGLKAKDLLQRKGYKVDDRLLTTRADVEAFKKEYEVKTTPQTFIDKERVGGYDDLRRFFGKSIRSSNSPTYKPVIALFSTTLLAALAASYAVFNTPFTGQALEWFIGLSMSILALLKLQDLESFSTMFLNYDLLAKQWVPYSYIYPFAEGLAGILMMGGLFPLLSAPLSLFIGTVGAASVFKAVYLDKRELKCACVGGANNVPLGLVSLIENLMMIAMGIWTLLSTLGLVSAVGHTM